MAGSTFLKEEGEVEHFAMLTALLVLYMMMHSPVDKVKECYYVAKLVAVVVPKNL